MCGISGFVAAGAEARPEAVRGPLDCLRHRGPDAEGWFRGHSGIVAQNRLAVIDLATGDPPIVNEDESIGVALNGEIYNFRELREELRGRGHEFRTAGDTEVIAHLAEELEPVELARRLDGMFAFAVWDDRRGRLLLGRDRMGKKPLYYWSGDGLFVFGSEIKAVLAHAGVPRSLDPAAIPAYLTFGYVPTPRTFYEGVLSVPPGHVLVVGADGGVTITRYWQPPIAAVNGTTRLSMPVDAAARELRALLTQAVDRRLVADVPLGAFLSGGLDSSSVVAVMAGLVDRPVKTFTIGFDDREGFDERPHARAVARRFGTDHTEFVVKPDAVDLVERLVWHYDQPFGDSSSIPTFMLSELTRGHVTVALCGDGGDELFAGYQRFPQALRLHRYARVPAMLRGVAERALGALPPDALGGRAGRAQRVAAYARADFPDALLPWISYVPEATRAALLREDSDWAVQDYRRLWAESEGAELLDRLLYLNLHTFLLDDLLPKIDRMSMAHALEVRSPLLDTDLVEFAMRLPPSTKLQGSSVKRVLREAVADLLPPEILERRKWGFAVPLSRWFRSDLRSYVDSMLGSPSARVRAHLVPDTVDALLAEHHSGARNHGEALWALLTLEVFLRREGW